jgi:hypothetical protein
MAARLSALCADRFLPPGRFLVLISVRGPVDPRAIVQLKGLGKSKNPPHPGLETATLAARSIVPQPTTLPRVPKKGIGYLKMITRLAVGVQIQRGALRLAHKLSYPMGTESSFPCDKVAKT